MPRRSNKTKTKATAPQSCKKPPSSIDIALQIAALDFKTSCYEQVRFVMMLKATTFGAMHSTLLSGFMTYMPPYVSANRVIR